MGRFNPKGIEKWLFFATANAPAAPAAITQAEVGAGTTVDMTGDANSEALFQSSGWNSSPSVINTPDIKSTETGNVGGDRTRGIATLQYYLDQVVADNTIKAAMTVGTTGFIVKAPMGTAATAIYENIPVTVVQNEIDDTQNTAKMFTLSFSQGTMTAGVFAA